jgi:L-rhamnose mutarotase
MIRKAFKMQLKAGFEAEYRKRHDEIWPELSRLLKEAGVSDYSIFLDPETLTLFAVQKLAPGSRADELAAEPVMRKWWDYMEDLMDCNPDHSPVCKDLHEVFHLD